ncbi:MAG: cupredoxin domain-containing protein [Patescibacteria group bacterium]
MENKTKKTLVMLGVLVVLAIIIIAIAAQNKKAVEPTPEELGLKPYNDQTAVEAPGGPEGTPIDEGDLAEPMVNEVLKDAVVAAPGANPITTEDKVVTSFGEETRNDVEIASPLAPAQTGPISKEDLAATAINLEISAAGYSPNEFRVKAGAPVTISLTGIDSAHTIVFEDPSLSAIAIGVYKNETRAITFNAPAQKGEYVFYCNVGGVIHKNRGEVGKMIVE